MNGCIHSACVQVLACWGRKVAGEGGGGQPGMDSGVVTHSGFLLPGQHQLMAACDILVLAPRL